MRPRVPVGAFSLFIGVALGLMAGLWVASRTALDGPVGPDGLPRGVLALRVDRPRGWWVQQGFRKMTPPIALPASGDERLHTEIWLRIPEGGVVRTVWVEGQRRYTLRFPEGTEADRLELWAHERRDSALQHTVADVRGLRILDEGRQRFRVLRPRTG